MVINRKLLISGVLFMVLFMINPTISPQTVVPTCFEKSDCKISIPKSYCDVSYDCIIGKCYSQPIKCQEICYGGEDEDLDGFKDCKDSDCFTTKYCPCEKKSYTECFYGNCYCPENKRPFWFVFEDGHQCLCTEGGVFYENG